MLHASHLHVDVLNTALRSAGLRLGALTCLSVPQLASQTFRSGRSRLSGRKWHAAVHSLQRTQPTRRHIHRHADGGGGDGEKKYGMLSETPVAMTAQTRRMGES